MENKKMSTKKIGNFFSNFTIDNARDFVDRHLNQIIYSICFIAAIAFVSVFVVSKYSENRNKLVMDYYQAANYIKNNQNEEALKILQNVYSSKYADQNIKTIAGVRIADILLSQNKPYEAREIYKEIYSFKHNDAFLKNLSGLAVLNIMINQNNQNDYPKIEKLIKDLSNPDNPVLTLVNEQAGIFEIQRGNVKEGLAILNDVLMQPNLDEDTRNRVESVIGLYKNEDI